VAGEARIPPNSLGGKSRRRKPSFARRPGRSPKEVPCWWHPGEDVSAFLGEDASAEGEGTAGEALSEQYQNKASTGIGDGAGEGKFSSRRSGEGCFPPYGHGKRINRSGKRARD